ncbi:MAG: hypothetical protein HKN47_25745 [Pirellulaceae bacterium]|nr:hypothetical protein [Pirellulaceae bacterium]
MHHPYFGDIDLEEDFAELPTIQSAQGEILVEIDAADRHPTMNELDGLATACKSHDVWTAKVLEQARTDYEDLLFDALSVWGGDDPTLLKQFNPDATSVADVTAEQAVSKLKLVEIRMEVSDPAEIAFDLHFDLNEENHYLVCGRFECDGTLSDVTLES